jgi:hypothetical protein
MVRENAQRGATANGVFRFASEAGSPGGSAIT